MNTPLNIHSMKKMFKYLKMINKNLLEINNKMKYNTNKN